MPTVIIDKEEIFYLHNTSDNRDNFVLIHGSGGDHSHWPSDLHEFPWANVYAIDLPGHGRSGGYGRKSVDAYTDFIDSFVQGLNLESVTLFGHSLGGAIAQMAALRDPGWLAKIVLVGTGVRLRVTHTILDGLLTDFKSTVDVICEYFFGPTAEEPLIQKIRKGFLKTNPGIFHGDFCCCDQFDIMDKIDQIACPTLVVSGTSDRLTPVKYGKYLYNNIPNAELSVIEEGGHIMALEKTQEFMEQVKAFFTEA